MRWLPENVSTYGGDIDALLSFIYSMTLFWFFLTIGLILVFLVVYRRREGRRAVYARGERFGEAAWILIPAAVVLVLDLWIDVRGHDAWAKVKGRVPATSHHVRVLGKQFNWEILYPGPDGKFGTADDLKLDNELHVPVNQVIHGTLRSKDVIHNFFLPNLRFKQDVLPGRDQDFWFQVTRPGRYEMPCAELCGFGHSGMMGYLYVHTPEEYQKWLKEHWPSS
jgi:cytochrome c oxidase subunit 2